MKSLTMRYCGWCLLATLVLSPALLADTAYVSEDAHIDLGNPQDNNGVVPNLVVSNIVDRKTGDRLTFVAYDLLDLPAGASLEQALLRIYVGRVGTAGDIDLYLVTEPWEEHGISAATAPDFEAAPFTTFSIVTADEGHFVTADVTPEVEDWLQGDEPNYGFVLVGNPGTDVDVSFDSKENGQTGHQSELELVLGTAVGGIDSEDIADNSIGTEDIEDGSIGSDDIADGSVGAADVDKDAIQLRISGSCAAGSSIREVDNLGAVTCEPDDDSGGDITSVFPAAGGGLAGGAASGDAELGIAPNGITSAMVADGTIGSADVDSSAVQLRVGGECAAGSSIRSIVSDGSVLCEPDDDTGAELDPDQFWKVGGNAGTSPIPAGTNFVGTTDEQDVVLGVNGMQTLRLSYFADGGRETVNVLGGHPVNRITAKGGTIAGGGEKFALSGVTRPNKVEGDFGTIGGGLENGVLNPYGFIGGGQGNLIGASALEYGGISNSVIVGGYFNAIERNGSDAYPYIGSSFIGGGASNKIVSSARAVVVGGVGNEIHMNEGGFIGGGLSNKLCDPDSFPDSNVFDRRDVIVGGEGNESCGGKAAILGGWLNVAAGAYSVVLGGSQNEALGYYSLAAGGGSKANELFSFALGSGANADHVGAFVWGDRSTLDPVHSERDNQVRFRAAGGARFDVGDDEGSYVGGNQWVDIRTQANNTYSNPVDFRLIDTSTGAYLSLGGGWVNASDLNRKTDIREIDKRWVLDQVASMPVTTWRYKVEDKRIRHIGPMAQDFQAAFGFGGNDKGIMTVDADGVALAAIQALYQVTLELERRTRQLEAQQHRLDALEAGLQALNARLDPFADRRLTQLEMNQESE